jgi:hypothetical protein
MRLIILSIFLFLALSGVAYAYGEQNVKLIHTDGMIEKIMPTYQKNNSDNQPVANHSQINTNITQTSLATVKTGTDMVTNGVSSGLMSVMFTVCDNVMNSAFSISGATATNNSKTLTYSLYAEEMNPFKAPFVQSILLITGALYYICWLIAIWVSLAIFGIQQLAPRTFTKIREAITGEEGYFDIFSMFETFCMWGGWPIGSFIIVSMFIFFRNLIVSAMTTNIIDNIGTSSSSLPTYFILCVGYYFNIIQKFIAEYGAYLIVSMLFVIGVILGFTTLFYSFKIAIRMAFFIAVLFGLLLSVDIITVFCIWFGVSMIVYTGNQGFSIAAILTAGTLDALILLSPVLFVYLKFNSGNKIIPGVL